MSFARVRMTRQLISACFIPISAKVVYWHTIQYIPRSIKTSLSNSFVSSIAIFVLKGDVKLQLTNSQTRKIDCRFLHSNSIFGLQIFRPLGRMLIYDAT